MLVREVPDHPHRMAFGRIKFHLPIGLPLNKAVPFILQHLAIHGGFYIAIKHTIIHKEVNRLPHVIQKIINENEKKDRTVRDPIGPGLDLRLDHPTPRFEIAQRAMNLSTCE